MVSEWGLCQRVSPASGQLPLKIWWRWAKSFRGYYRGVCPKNGIWHILLTGKQFSTCGCCQNRVFARSCPIPWAGLMGTAGLSPLIRLALPTAISLCLLYICSLWLLTPPEASLYRRLNQPRLLTRLSSGRPYSYFSLCCVCCQPLHLWQGCLIGRWVSGDLPPFSYMVSGSNSRLVLRCRSGK